MTAAQHTFASMSPAPLTWVDEELASIAMAKAMRDAAPHLSAFWLESAEPETRLYWYRRAGVRELPASVFARCDATALRYARAYHRIFVGFEA